MILRAIWDENLDKVPADSKIETWAEQVLSAVKTFNSYIVFIGSGTQLDALRLLVIKGLIKSEELSVEFGEETLTINEYGRFNKYPKGLGDLTNDQAEEILTMAVKKRKAKRK